MERKLLISGSTLLAIAVALGALGAHWLKSQLTGEQLTSFETGVRYHFHHGFAILLLIPLKSMLSEKQLRLTFRLFFAGICLFSGSIYLLATRELWGGEGIQSFLGPITPLGGLVLIGGWVSLIIAGVRSKTHRKTDKLA